MTKLLAATAALALTAGAAAAATVTVDSLANSSTGGTGLATGFAITAGQTYTFSADPADTWSLGSNDADCNREGNADGLANCPAYPSYAQGGLTAAYGTLVGQIDGSDFFVVGTNLTFTAMASGELFLYNFDSFAGDNSGSIDVTLSAVPLPAAGLLLLGALGALGLRRRKAV